MKGCKGFTNGVFCTKSSWALSTIAPSELALMMVLTEDARWAFLFMTSSFPDILLKMQIGL